MKWLAITQRVNVTPDEIQDCVDQRWNDIALALGFMPIHLPIISAEHVTTLLDALKPSAILLTGGNSLGTAPERDQFELALLKQAIGLSIPVLGVCRGMQVINQYYGGNVVIIDNHVNTRHAIQTNIEKISLYDANSYHQFGILPNTLGNHLHVFATADDGSIEGFKHHSDRVTGIMWHPEREPTLRLSDQKIFEEALT